MSTTNPQDPNFWQNQRWQVKLAGNWKEFSEAEDAAIKQAYMSGRSHFYMEARRQKYRVDFERMSQKNVSTEPFKERWIRHISLRGAGSSGQGGGSASSTAAPPVPPDLSSLRSTVAAAGGGGAPPGPPNTTTNTIDAKLAVALVPVMPSSSGGGPGQGPGGPGGTECTVTGIPLANRNPRGSFNASITGGSQVAPSYPSVTTSSSHRGPGGVGSGSLPPAPGPATPPGTPPGANPPSASGNNDVNPSYTLHIQAMSTGKQFQVVFPLHTTRKKTTVKDLKRAIEKHAEGGIPAAEQRLLYAGRQLEDDDRELEGGYHVRSGGAITMMVKYR